MSVHLPPHLRQRCPEVVASSNPHWNTGKGGESSWMHKWMLPSMNATTDPSAGLYVEPSQLDSVSGAAAVSAQYCRLYVSQEDTAAMSTRKLKKPLFPDLHCDNVASAPQRNVKAPSCRRNKGRNDCGEKTPRSPDPPVASLCISAEGTGRWMRSSQTRARALPEDPEPQWNTRKMRGSAQKRDGLPSRASPDMDDTSPEQPSNHSLRVRRAKRSNRLHKKRGEDSAQLQHLEESRMEVRKRGGAEKDDNKRSSEPTNMKSSTSSKTPKTHKGSAKILSEEDEDKWTEDELARLQEYVWFSDYRVSCCLTESHSAVCLSYPGQWRSIPNTRPVTGQRWPR